jgi:predicted PurR-regulated permease PerM
MTPAPSGDITRIVLLVLVIGLLLVGSFWTLLPFLGALIWAVTIAVATWPLLMLVQRKTGGRRSVAVLIMMTLVLLAFVAPLALAVARGRRRRTKSRAVAGLHGARHRPTA